MIFTQKQAKKLKLPVTIDLKEMHAREYLQSKKSKMETLKENALQITGVAGVIWFIIVTLFGWGVIDTPKVNAFSDRELQNLPFVIKFPTEKRVIGCYNDYTKVAREGTSCTKAGDHNILLPSRSHITEWLNHFNEQETVNRLALVNFESSFIEENGNPYAYGYVQTLRKWGVAPDINSQLKWLKNRQDHQKVEYTAGGSKRCGYYWKNNNTVDGFSAGEYGVLSCLYRYHYHAYKGTWYAKRGIEATLYYKWYMYDQRGQTFEEYKASVL